MKKYFLTGLVILLPLALTIAIVVFIINLFTGPFVGFFVQQLQDFSWYKHYAPLIHALLKILLIVILFFFTVLLGFLTRALLFNSLLKLSDYVMHRIPLIRTIYKASQQVIKTLFESSSRSFKQVVLVPFPSQSSYAIGLISSATPAICETTLGQSLITVFVPTTPNPTSGFLMIYKKEEVVFLDMKVEDALKYVISCGAITDESIAEKR